MYACKDCGRFSCKSEWSDDKKASASVRNKGANRKERKDMSDVAVR